MSFKHMRRHAFEQLVNSMLKLQQEITHFYDREALWSSGYSSSIMAHKVAVSREFEARYLDWKTLSVHPAENGYLFRIREG